VEHIAKLNEVVLRGLGELNLRTVIELINERYNLELQTSLPSIEYRETITPPAEGHHRHKKQTGGDGSFTMDFSHYAEVPRESLDTVTSKSKMSG